MILWPLMAKRMKPRFHATRVEDRDWLLKNFMTELFIVLCISYNGYPDGLSHYGYY